MNRRQLLGASALAYGAIGVAGLLRPAKVPAVFGGTAQTPASRTEIRTVYGGLPLAVAGLIAADSPRSALPMAVLSAGMAAGRALGMTLEEEPASVPTKFFLGVELALAGALGIGSRLRH